MNDNNEIMYPEVYSNEFVVNIENVRFTLITQETAIHLNNYPRVYANGRPNYDKLESYNAGGFTILVYDSEARENPVKAGTIADLSDYKTTGKGSMIFLQSAYTTNGKIIVYR